MFAGEALSRLGGVAMGQGRGRAAAALDDGSALESFRRMVQAQGGDGRVVDDPWGVLPAAPDIRPIVCDREGFLTRVDAEAIGRASAALGAGRVRKGDPVDPAVGIVFRPKIGDRVEEGQEIGSVHARDDDAVRACTDAVLSSIEIGGEAVEPVPLVHAWVGD
jgi:pyrimidine-nucleoside phosphorylase